MALTTCRECGKEVANSAKACPHCGVDRPGLTRQTVSPAMGCLILAALGVVGLMVLMDAGSSGGSSSSSSYDPPPLRATVRFTGTQLTIENGDTFDWRNCEVAINPGFFGGGWRTRAPLIAAGETVAAGILTFTAKDGQRFNAATHAVEDAELACDAPHGRAFWSGTYR